MNLNHIYYDRVDITFPNSRTGSLVLAEDRQVSHENLIYFRTENPDGFHIEGRQGHYLLGILENVPSNLDLWTISLNGPDGVRYACDFIGRDSANRIWGSLQSRAWVSPEDLPSFYLGE